MTTEGEPIKPIILDGGGVVGSPPRAGGPATTPGVIAMRAPSAVHAGLRGGVAAFLVLAGIGNFVAATGFPTAAPVEQLYTFLLSVDMFLAAIVLSVFAVLAATRRSVPVHHERTSPLSIAALSLSAVPFLAWVLFGLIPTLAALDAPRYMTEVGVLVLFGIPWILGIAFGAISLRSGGPRTTLFGGIALGLGLILVLAVLAATILYGLGLTQ